MIGARKLTVCALVALQFAVVVPVVRANEYAALFKAANSYLAIALNCAPLVPEQLQVARDGYVYALVQVGLSRNRAIVYVADIELEILKNSNAPPIESLIGSKGRTRQDVLKSCRQLGREASYALDVEVSRLLIK